MRVGRLDHGHTIGQKLILTVIRLTTGFRAPDVVKTLFYRKAFFGAHQSRLTQDVMRGPSEWTVGQRELFAAYVSRLSQCPFWTGAHTAVAVRALGDEELARRILDDPARAPDGKLRAALAFLKKLSLTPEAVTDDDVRVLLEAGVSRQGVADAIYVWFLFAIYTRLSDTLGWEVPSASSFEASAKVLLTRGYV